MHNFPCQQETVLSAYDKLVATAEQKDQIGQILYGEMEEQGA